MNNYLISNKSVVADINKYASKYMRLNFSIYEYNGKELILVGSEDETSCIQIEIIFEDLFFISAFFSWHTNPREDIIVIPEDNEIIKLNKQFEIEAEYQLFRLIPEGHDNMFYVAAKSIDYEIGNQ